MLYSYSIFRETIPLLAQEMYAFGHVVTRVVQQNIKYTLVFKFTVLVILFQQNRSSFFYIRI